MKQEETPAYDDKTDFLTFIEGHLDGDNNNSQESGAGKNVSFRYTGKRPLAMRGLISGKKYYFNKPGKIIEIDHRDLIFFEGVSRLEKLE